MTKTLGSLFTEVTKEPSDNENFGLESQPRLQMIPSLTISRALQSLLKYVSVELEMPLEIKSIKYLRDCEKNFM